MAILLLKSFFLFVAILYGVTIALRMYVRNGIHPAQTILFALGLTGFIMLQFLI